MSRPGVAVTRRGPHRALEGNGPQIDTGSSGRSLSGAYLCSSVFMCGSFPGEGPTHVPDDARAPIEAGEEPFPVGRECHYVRPVVAGIEREDLLAGLDVEQADGVGAEVAGIEQVRGRQRPTVGGQREVAAVL